MKIRMYFLVKLYQDMFKLINSNLRTFLITILFIILSYKCIKYLWKRRYWYYSTWKMDGPFNWPLIGYGWKFFGSNQDMYEVFDNFCKLYKTPAVFWVGPKLNFIITNPNHYEIILNRTLNKTDLYDFLSEYIGNGLLTAPVDKWKRHRKLIKPTFNQKILNSYVEIFSEESKNLIKDLKKFVGQGFFNIFPFIDHLTTTLICRTAMGNVVLTKKQILTVNEGINTILDLSHYRAFKIWYHPKIFWDLTPQSKKVYEAAKNIHQIVKEQITQKRKACKIKIKQNIAEEYENRDDNSKLMSFMDYLIKISEETGQLTDDEIMQEVEVLAGAGTHTTATTIGFFSLMIGLYADIQNKIFEELCSIFGDSDRSVEVDDLNKMVYLERVIKETMRLCPTIPFVIRKLDEDIRFESYIFPKDSSCYLLIRQTHRDPKFWNDPLKFDPDRFLPEEVAKRHPYSFIPFSAGPRNCIGFNYSLKAMKVILSTLLRTYKVSTSYKKFSDIKFSQAIVLKCVGGFNVALENRK